MTRPLTQVRSALLFGLFVHPLDVLVRMLPVVHSLGIPFRLRPVYGQ